MKKVSKLSLFLFLMCSMWMLPFKSGAQLMYTDEGGCPAISIQGPVVVEDGGASNFNSSAAVMTYSVRFDVTVDWTACPSEPEACSQLLLSTTLGSSSPGTVSYRGITQHGSISLINAQQFNQCDPTSQVDGFPVFGMFPGPTDGAMVKRFSVIVSWDYKPEKIEPVGTFSVYYIKDRNNTFSVGKTFFDLIHVGADVSITFRYTAGAHLDVPLYPRFPSVNPPVVATNPVPTTTGAPLTLVSKMIGGSGVGGTVGFAQSAFATPPVTPPNSAVMSEATWMGFVNSPVATGPVSVDFTWQRNPFPFNSWGIISGQNNSSAGTTMICEGVNFRTRTKASLLGAPTVVSNWTNAKYVGPTNPLPTTMYVGQAPVNLYDYRIVSLDGYPSNTTWSVSQGAQITNSTNTNCTVYINALKQSYAVTATYNTPCGTTTKIGILFGATGVGEEGAGDRDATAINTEAPEFKVTSDNQSVQLIGTETAEPQNRTFVIFDLLGRQQASMISADNTVEFDTTDLPSGIYVLNVIENGKVIFSKKLPLVK